MPLTHVMFDGKPEVICHTCAWHKSLGDALPCDDAKGSEGECAHVQYAACDCRDLVIECDLCLAAGVSN